MKKSGALLYLSIAIQHQRAGAEWRKKKKIKQQETKTRGRGYSNSSSRLLEVVGVAGFESWESDATVTILGEPRTSSSPVSSMSSVVMMARAVPPFLFWWVLMCLERWSLLINRLEHSGHSNLFSPIRKHEMKQTKLQNELQDFYHLPYIILFYPASNVLKHLSRAK